MRRLALPTGKAESNSKPARPLPPSRIWAWRWMPPASISADFTVRSCAELTQNRVTGERTFNGCVDDSGEVVFGRIEPEFERVFEGSNRVAQTKGWGLSGQEDKRQ